MFSICTLHYPDRSELVNYCEHRCSDIHIDKDIIVNGDCIPEVHGKHFVAAKLDGNRVIRICSDDRGKKDYVYNIK